MVDQSIIVGQGFDALRDLAWCIDTLLRKHPAFVPAGTGVIISDGEVPALISRICHAQSLAYACLFDDSEKRPGEALRHKVLRHERVRTFRQRVSGLRLAELPRRGPRNALAHFDDRILKLLADDPEATYLINIGITSRSLSVPADGQNIHYYMAYIYETDELVMFDEVLRLKPLRQEVDAILISLGMPA